MILLLILMGLGPPSSSIPPSPACNGSATAAARHADPGLELILNHSFLPQDFHQSTFDELWRDWPEPLRSHAENAPPAGRNEMAFARYGFTPRPAAANKPLQYVVDRQGWWAMNCFACHGGCVDGKPYPGAPNSSIALETLYEDLRKTKTRLGRPFNEMDVGSIIVPMGTTVGTSNAVVFGIALMSYRDKDLNLRPFRLPPRVTHHDMDAPAWWNVKYRSRLYIDGFVEKNHRALIPFVMDRRNSGETLRGWDDEFQVVYRYIESLQPPAYPLKIDVALANRGEDVFHKNCARCHGTYGARPSYPGKIVELAEIGTDPVRLSALTAEHRRGYHDSWYAHYGQDDTVIEPSGYQAPPLHGIWASAPYFHNGSVPTLWHVLNPKDRPKIWIRSEPGDYDYQKLGLAVQTPDALPERLRSDQRRKYFDTSVFGKSAAGHVYPAKLTEHQKIALLEYLKTL